MRAMVMHRHGGPEVLTLEPEWPRPEPGPGEILVEVHACALNFLDIFTREGMPGEPTPLPHITGGDVAGIVAAVGAGVTRPAVGARVLIDPNWGCGACEYCRERRAAALPPRPHARRDGPGRARRVRDVSGEPGHRDSRRRVVRRRGVSARGVGHRVAHGGHACAAEARRRRARARRRRRRRPRRGADREADGRARHRHRVDGRQARAHRRVRRRPPGQLRD